MADLGELLAVLELAAAGEGRFRARNLDLGHGTVFGGQLLAQAVVAASLAVPGKELLSLHTVFARAARPERSLDLVVDVVHDGRSFATVAVAMGQDDRVCVESLALLHAPDPDLIRHGPARPAGIIPPDELPARPNRLGPWDVRIVGDVDLADPAQVGPAQLQVWSRFADAPEGLALSQALLAYASDGFLIGTAMRPHAGVGQSQAHVSVATTVLAQTLSFHEPFHAGDWLLLDQRSTYAGRGRSRGEGQVFATDGRLVASFTQDNMIRG